MPCDVPTSGTYNFVIDRWAAPIPRCRKGPHAIKMPQAPDYPTQALSGVIAALQVAAMEWSTLSTAFLRTTHLSQNSQNTAIILF